MFDKLTPGQHRAAQRMREEYIQPLQQRKEENPKCPTPNIILILLAISVGFGLGMLFDQRFGTPDRTPVSTYVKGYQTWRTIAEQCLLQQQGAQLEAEGRAE